MPAPTGRALGGLAANRPGLGLGVVRVAEASDLAHGAPEHGFVALVLRHAEEERLELPTVLRPLPRFEHGPSSSRISSRTNVLHHPAAVDHLVGEFVLDVVGDVGLIRFERTASASRTQRSDQAELQPEGPVAVIMTSGATGRLPRLGSTSG